MAIVTSLVILLNYFFYFFGQLGRVNLRGYTFPAIDISLFFLFLVNLWQHYQTHRLKISNRPFVIFLIFAWTTLAINFLLVRQPIIKPILYLCRLTFLLSFFILPVNLKFRGLFSTALVSNIVFGLIQYILWPNFTYFSSENWDPHLNRLVSTYFDPTFTGLIYLLFLVFVFLNRKFPYRRFVLILTYLALALTYSRSTYLAFILAFLFIAKSLKNWKIFWVSLGILIITLILLPHPPGEGTNLGRDASIKAKIINYQEGINLFTTSPFIGVGYDNLPNVRRIDPVSHAAAGFDSSLLTILVTTGLLGFFPFVLGFYEFYRQSTLLTKVLLLATFIHSFFANSLLYPWILLFVVFTTELKYRKLSIPFS